MKRISRALAISLTLLVAHPVAAIVGYVNFPFFSGDNLFQNPLEASGDNHLSALFGPGTPNNTAISLWDPVANAYSTTSVYFDGSWSIDFELHPGTGARLTTGALFTNTFVGTVLNHSGFTSGGDFSVPPPLFSGPNGIYLLGDKAPLASTGVNVFRYILGREPNPGEQFTRLDAASQTYITSTFLDGGAWDVVPSLRVGEAGFFNIGPIPEPSSTALSLLGLAMFGVWRRRQH
jgi:hypothetical protein